MQGTKGMCHCVGLVFGLFKGEQGRDSYYFFFNVWLAWKSTTLQRVNLEKGYESPGVGENVLRTKMKKRKASGLQCCIVIA